MAVAIIAAAVVIWFAAMSTLVAGVWLQNEDRLDVRELGWADLSVYAERSHRGKGVGSALLSRLIELGRDRGFHKLVLSAFPTNHGGMALYTKHGFRTVGIYKEQGVLDGRWVDTIVMEKLL